MARYPVSETELGYWVKYKYPGGAAHFVPITIEWQYYSKGGHRVDTWENFKKEYPYRSNNIKSRYKVCPKWACIYNR